jgi:hypothetical protein
MYNAAYRRILSRMGYYNYQNGLIYRMGRTSLTLQKLYPGGH